MYRMILGETHARDVYYQRRDARCEYVNTRGCSVKITRVMHVEISLSDVCGKKMVLQDDILLDARCLEG